MNRAALKSYAPKARLDFIRAVTDRAAFHGLTKDRTEPMQATGDVVIIGGRAFPKVVANQRRSLEGRIRRQGFDQVMEAMAYTWSNRFVALRYMELHGYLDHGYRVLSHPEGKATPEIVEHAEHVTLPGLNPQQVINLKLDGSREAELYRLLLVAQCNALHEAMPFLFEKIADETELLLPDNLLHSDSLIRKLVNELDEADWQQVEIIGWLYQFYISDKKAEVIGKVVKSEDIPAATQLFTPNWIVKYLVQNTLGRQWLATYPDSPLRQQMEYYIEPAEQTDDVKTQLAVITPKSLDPEKLTLLDPASGSGHILVEAYDLFKAIYQERGYRSKDIPRLILEKNLFGLEIDDRAAQLAAFALLMRARADDHRIFTDRIQPNVVAIQESKGLESLLRPDPAAAADAGELPFADSDLFPDTQRQLTLTKRPQESPLVAVEPCLRELITLFEQGKTFGSLIRVPPTLAAQLPAARQNVEAMIAKGQLWEHHVATLLVPLIKQAEFLARTYDAVVTNPPYMGNNAMNLPFKTFAKCHYPSTAADAFAMFIERCLSFTRHSAFTGLVTPFVWMFIASFEALRRKLLSSTTLSSLVQLEYNAFEPACVPVCAFTLHIPALSMFAGVFIDLSNFKGIENQAPRTLKAIKDQKCSWRYVVSPDDFHRLPGSPIAFSLDPRFYEVFRTAKKVGELADVREGINTGDNDRFLRMWFEVDFRAIGFQCKSIDDARDSGKKWFPHNKGGGLRRWYGNNDYVVNWQNDGEEIRNLRDADGRLLSRPQNTQYFFRSGITWSGVGSSGFGTRIFREGFTFNSAGRCLFPAAHPLFLLAVLNSRMCRELLKVIAPTLSFTVGNIASVPVLFPSDKEHLATAEHRAAGLVELARSQWDSQETSWDFQQHPLLSRGSDRKTVPSEKHELTIRLSEQRKLVQQLEAENDQFVERLYGLEGRLSKEAEALAESDGSEGDLIQSLLSYAIGCMMGRYSLDKPGLVYAQSRNEGFDPSQYRTFPADAYGIIPTTELAWFPDDAMERFVEFIAKAWPHEHLEENLKFIADSLGSNRDEHPRDTIRRYLSQGFYRDHLQSYKGPKSPPRPIYWLFSSGKQRAFQCLVYLHRYHEGTLARMRTEYVIPLQGKMSHRIEQLAGDIAAATSTSHRRKLEKERETLVRQRTELAAFDEKLRHYADQRIALDLDDGVKVNYGKFGDLLAEVKLVTGGTEE